jgi:hypothetical protein
MNGCWYGDNPREDLGNAYRGLAPAERHQLQAPRFAHLIIEVKLLLIYHVKEHTY